MRKKTKDEQDTLFTALVEALDDYGKALSALRNNQYSISVFLKTFLRILETSDLPKREVSVIRRLIQFADEDMFSAETLAEGALQRSLQSLQEISRLLKK